MFSLSQHHNLPSLIPLTYYFLISAQKISPVGKPKVQLQVVLHNGECSTFHFVNPAGAEVQVIYLNCYFNVCAFAGFVHKS